MKIDVITLHRVRNYGSSLQTLATQKFFQDKGCDVEIIDYYPERYSSLGLLKRLKNKSERLAKNPILLFMARVAISFSYLRKKIVFDKFLKKHILLTPKTYRTEKELIDDCPDGDAYCTGSDQVWNSHWNEGVDRPLYLSFLPDEAYRFSYAGSIGNSKLSPDEAKQVYPLLRRYRHITVRENNGVDILNNIGLNEVEQMPDPTLLFDKNFWDGFASDRYKNKKYVVTYNLHHDKKIDEFANKLAAEKGIKVYNISYNWHDIIRKGTLKWCPSTEGYLGLIKYAEYVVTDSFHATVFSLIFGTKFIDIFPQEASSRLRSLLTLTHTTHRGFDGMPDTKEADTIIDFNAVSEILKAERAKADAYLDKVISEISDSGK